MSNRKLAHQAAGLFFVFSIGFGLVWAADDGVRDNGDKYAMLLALILMLYGLWRLLHLLADLWSDV